MKSYTKRKDGVYRKTRKFNVHIPQESVEKIMEKKGVGMREAERLLVQCSFAPEVSQDNVIYLTEFNGTWLITNGLVSDFDGIILEPATFEI